MIVSWCQVKEIVADMQWENAQEQAFSQSKEAVLTVLWFGIFLIYSVLRYFSANSRKGSFCLLRLADFCIMTILKNPKEGGGKKVNLRYSFLLSLLPCSKWYLILFLSLFRIKAVIIHFLCCDNPLPKCPGSIIWLWCLDSYHITPTKQQ